MGLSVVMLLLFGEEQALSQEKLDEIIARRLEQYCRSVPWEDIFVQSDRDEYVAGENIWVNTFLIDRQSGKLSSLSRIAYLEILNSENRSVVQKRIALTEGHGGGNLELPDTLSTGVYLIRAYTNYMKNFMPENCFMKEFIIYNALKGQSKHVSRYSVFRDFSYENPGNELLEVDNSDPDLVRLTIRNTGLFKEKELLYLLVQSHGVVSSGRQIVLSGEAAAISLLKAGLPGGVNNIVLFSSEGKPLAERYIYIPRRGNKAGGIRVESISEAGKREKTTVELVPENADIESYEISVSVSPSKGKYISSCLEDYLIFGTEFGILPAQFMKRSIDEIDPDLIDSFLSGTASRWINWEKIMSGQVPSLKFQFEENDHFLSGTLLDQNSQSGVPGKYMFMSVPGKTAQFKYSVTDQTGNFLFRIPADTELRDLIIQPEETGNRSIIKLNSPFCEEYLPFSLTGDSIPVILPENASRLCVNYQVSRIYGIPSFMYPENINATAKKVKRFYGKPDIELVMTDYIKLPVMQEVFFELLPGVQMKSRKSGYDISIADPVEGKYYDKSPVLFVDGVVVNDASVIANIDPELVERIDVVKERYLVGEYLFYGLINVITYAGDLSSVTLPEYAVRIPYKVIEPPNIFYSPGYQDPAVRNSRIPDFRNTLYWNPSLIPDKEGRLKAEFWTGDVSGDYIIDIQGIKDDGTKISIQRTLKVK